MRERERERVCVCVCEREREIKIRCLHSVCVCFVDFFSSYSFPPPEQSLPIIINQRNNSREERKEVMKEITNR